LQSKHGSIDDSQHRPRKQSDTPRECQPPYLGGVEGVAAGEEDVEDDAARPVVDGGAVRVRAPAPLHDLRRHVPRRSQHHVLQHLRSQGGESAVVGTSLRIRLYGVVAFHVVLCERVPGKSVQTVRQCVARPIQTTKRQSTTTRLFPPSKYQTNKQTNPSGLSCLLGSVL
jgi:hypothetical protein